MPHSGLLPHVLRHTTQGGILTDKDQRLVLIYAVTLGAAVRFVIEALNPDFPLGQDTLSYSLCLRFYHTAPNLDLLYFGPPIPYLIALITQAATGLNDVMVWKYLSVPIHAAVTVSLAYMMMRAFKWGVWKTMYLVVLYTSYFVTIVFSNSMYSQHLATAFFFLAITGFVIDGPMSWRTLMPTILVALTHTLVSTMLFGFIAADALWRYATNEPELARKGVILGVVLVMLVGVVTFVLPALSSPNVVGEMMSQVASYVTGSALGAATNVPAAGGISMRDHFLIYCWLLVPFAILGIMRDRFLLTWLFVVLIGAFLPIGWAWKRWQWMATAPLLVFAANGVHIHHRVPNLRIRHILNMVPYVLLFLVVLNGAAYAVSDVVINRSSVSFQHMGEIQDVCADVLPTVLLNDRFLFISSYENFRVYEYFLGAQYPNATFIRDYMVQLDGDTLFIMSSTVRGQDFYTFRQPSIRIDVTSYPHIFLVVDEVLTYYNYTGPYLHLFTEVIEHGGTKIYALE